MFTKFRHDLAGSGAYIDEMKQIALSLAALGLAACANSGATTATLTPQQCAANWAAVGEADGADGARAGKLDGYRAACARSGAPLTDEDEAAWRNGWKTGVATLCAANDADLDVRQANARIGLCGENVAAADTVHTHSDGHTHTHRRATSHHHHGYYDHHQGPRIFPTFGFGLGIGSRGTTFGSGVGIGIGFPLYHRHY